MDARPDDAARPEAADLRSIWRSRGVDLAALTPDSDGTIRPAAPGLSVTLPPLEAAPEQQAPLPRLDDGEGGIRLGETLGQGGMGVVKRARQLPLGRDVAVKIVRDAANPVRAEAELLREARVTGLLEHPNVVPVHALCRDDRDLPAIVMKRIAGVEWTTLIRNPEHPRPGDEGDAQEFHLNVFLQVCSAVQFAHSRQLVHRDLKPDNVMIGEFGEVYVLDWGLAAGTGDHPPPGVPHVRDIHAVAGTPQYMAPEQATADGNRIGEHTDIYQLGCILHECITGRARHSGATVSELLESAYHSVPFAYADVVPDELAAICNRACAADPARRYQDVGELRAAVLAFRRHRSATMLAREARLRLVALRSLIAGGSASVQELRLHGLFSECRFGFQQALAAWPECVEASAGLRTARLLMAEFELGRGDLHSASVLVGELEDPPDDLVARLRALRAREAQDQARQASLQQLERDMDLSIGARTRVALAVQIAVLFGALPLLLRLAVERRWMPFDNRVPGVIAVAFSLFCLIALGFTRHVMRGTEVGRRIIRVVFTLASAMLLIVGLAANSGIEAPRTMAFLLLNNAVGLGAMAAMLDRRLSLAALPFVAGAALAVFYPRAALEISAGANFVAPLLIAASWRPRVGASGLR